MGDKLIPLPGPDEPEIAPFLPKKTREYVEFMLRHVRGVDDLRRSPVKRRALLATMRQFISTQIVEAEMMEVLRSEDARTYARMLRKEVRARTMTRIRAEADDTVDDYFWARRRARETDDYKATHAMAADHLDRIGASEAPPKVAVQVATIQLRSRNFDEADLLKPSPELLPESSNES